MSNKAISVSAFHTISLPRSYPSAPMVTFPVDKVRIYLVLTPKAGETSRITVYDLDSRVRYVIDSEDRNWLSALVIVGKLLVDSPELFQG